MCDDLNCPNREIRLSDLYLEYMLSRVPAYTRMQGGAAA